MRIINLFKLQHKISYVAILSRMKNFAKISNLSGLQEVCWGGVPRAPQGCTRRTVRRRSPRSLRSPSALGFPWLRPIIWSFAYGFTPGGWLARSLGSLAPLQSSVVRRACRHRSLASRERPARGVLLVQSSQGSKLPTSFYLRCWAFSQSHFIYSFSRSVLFRRVSSSANAYSIVTASLL